MSKQSRYNLRDRKKQGTNPESGSENDISDEKCERATRDLRKKAVDTSGRSTSTEDSPSESEDSPDPLTSQEIVRNKQVPSTRLYPSLSETGTQSHARIKPKNIYPSLNFESCNVNHLEKKYRKKESTQSFQCCNKFIVYLVGIQLVVLAIISAWNYFLTGNYPSTNSSLELDTPEAKFKQFHKKVAELNKLYPGQELRLWNTMAACAKHIFDSPDTYPAVLLLVAEKNNSITVSKMANSLALDFETVLNVNVTDTHDLSYNMSGRLSGKDAGQQKLELDQWLVKQLDAAQRVVVLHHLEVLQPDAVLLLHGYCDGDNAPYKNVLLMLVLYVDSLPINDRDAEQILKEMWTTKLSPDKVNALLSRVANNIGLVKSY